jgi:hypothetical protein
MEAGARCQVLHNLHHSNSQMSFANHRRRKEGITDTEEWLLLLLIMPPVIGLEAKVYMELSFALVNTSSPAKFIKEPARSLVQTQPNDA